MLADLMRPVPEMSGKTLSSCDFPSWPDSTCCHARELERHSSHLIVGKMAPKKRNPGSRKIPLLSKGRK